jgi:hypothetical protein
MYMTEAVLLGERETLIIVGMMIFTAAVMEGRHPVSLNIGGTMILGASVLQFALGMGDQVVQEGPRPVLAAM